METLHIVTGQTPHALVAFAAEELRRYVSRLFGITTTISPKATSSDAIVFLDSQSAGVQPPADDQCFLLRRVESGGKRSFIAIGGSPVATLWAVYDLVERWGVNYLFHGDVFPENPGSFHFPEIDRTFTPNFRARAWRLINDYVCGPEAWGLEEYRRFLDQLAKLKFNEVFLDLWPYQSYVHYEFLGVAKRTGVSWHGSHYPIDDDTVGREIFGDATEFENPDLTGLRDDYRARHEAARRHAQGILDHAKRRGMRTGLDVKILEYPLEFMAVLPGSEVATQLGSMACRPAANQDPDDPLLHELIRTMIRAHVQTYPDIDCLYMQVPEHRAWMDRAETAWQRLDVKYGISRVMSLDDAVAKAAKRTQVHGGAERQVARVKADVTMLYLLDQVLADDRVLQRPNAPAPRLIYNGLAEELLPLLPKVLRKGGGSMSFVDYTARRVVDQIDALDAAPTDKIPSRLIFTLEDDNIGLQPQFALKPLHELASRIRQRGWEGFSTRYWIPGSHDLTAHYLARSSWDAEVTPRKSCADLLENLCGQECVPSLLQAWELIEDVTDAFDRHGISFAFTEPKMLMKYWNARQPMSPVFREVRRKYEEAWDLVKKASGKSKPSGKPFVNYQLGRLRYGVCYINTVDAVCAAGVADKEGREGDAKSEIQKALVSLREAIESYASVAADNSDRGAVAALNQYCYKPLRNKLAELTKERVLHERTV